MPNSIVVPLDGTPQAEVALGPALDIARAFAAPVTVFRACADERDVEAAHRDLVHAGAAGTSVAVRPGIAASGIADTLAEHRGGLVCMSTRAHAGAGAVVLGGVAARVLHAVAGPVVLIGPHGNPESLAGPLRGPMVVGFDGSTAADDLLLPATEWACALGLDLDLVTVVHHGDRVGERSSSAVRALAEQRVAELRLAGVTARCSVVNDLDPARGITHRAEAVGAALVAVARHRGHAGLGRVVLGPVALRVVRHAPAPVLVGPRGIDGLRRFSRA